MYITDKDIQQARKTLGDTVKEWDDEKLKEELTKIQFLTESWLDEFERKTFDGKTLAEIIPGFNNYKITEELKNEI